MARAPRGSRPRNKTRRKTGPARAKAKSIRRPLKKKSKTTRARVSASNRQAKKPIRKRSKVIRKSAKKVSKIPEALTGTNGTEKLVLKRVPMRQGTTNKLDFIDAVAYRLKVQSKLAREVIDGFCDELIRRVKHGPVQTPIGTFLVRKLKPRNVYDIGRNKVVKHSSSKVLRLMVATSVDEEIKSSKKASAIGQRRRTL